MIVCACLFEGQRTEDLLQLWKSPQRSKVLLRSSPVHWYSSCFTFLWAAFAGFSSSSTTQQSSCQSSASQSLPAHDSCQDDVEACASFHVRFLHGLGGVAGVAGVASVDMLPEPLPLPVSVFTAVLLATPLPTVLAGVPTVLATMANGVCGGGVMPW